MVIEAAVRGGKLVTSGYGEQHRRARNIENQKRQRVPKKWQSKLAGFGFL